MTRLPHGLRLALGTLTIVPVGELPPTTPAVARSAMLLGPVAALPLGVGTALLLWAGHALGLPSTVTGLLVVGFLAWATRAMHLDGLADTVDGFGAGWSRERALEVMKRGDIGPMGTVAVLVSSGLQAVAFGALAGHAVLAGACVVASRGACAALAARPLTAARPGGLGAAVAGTVPLAAVAALWTALTACLAALSWSTNCSLWAALIGGVLSAAAVARVARSAQRVFGGVTGDVFGAGVEIALVLLLLPLTARGLS